MTDEEWDKIGDNACNAILNALEPLSKPHTPTPPSVYTRIALIAHDGKKADMVGFVMKRLEYFTRGDVKIVATGTTGKMIMHAGVTKVQTVNSGPMGGDAEIGAMVARGEIDAVIFFRDPLDAHPHETDVQMLMRVCDVYDVPLATNYKAGSILIEYYNKQVVTGNN